MQCAHIISGYFKFVIGLLVAICSTEGPPLSLSVSLSNPRNVKRTGDRGQKQGQVWDEILFFC